MQNVLKLIIMTPINYLLILIAFAYYELGFVIWGIYLALQFVLIILNYIISKNIFMQIFLSVNLFISTVVSNIVSGYNYYNNISNDSGTFILCFLATIFGCLIVSTFSTGAIILKHHMNKNGH